MIQPLLNRDVDEVLRLGYRLTPATLANHISQGMWSPAKHLMYISSIVASAIIRGNARIILCMPPRHGKSEFTSIWLPTWFLDWWPEKYVILSSYGAELATDFARKTRDIITENPQHLKVRLRDDAQQVSRFLTTQGGGMYSVGIGGTITGRGGHLLLVDDYIKNAEDSMSETLSAKAYDWWRSTAYTRLEPGGSAIILATRWNVRDLIGKVVETDSKHHWTVINLPALALENDPLGRTPGEALWPERYTRESLLEIQDVLGTYWFNSMYQQNPMTSMSGLAIGDQISIISAGELPSDADMKWVRAWDFAASEEKGDYTAGPLYGLHKPTGRFFIADLEHFRKSPKATEDVVRAKADADGAGIAIWIEQEPGSAGKTVISHYQLDVLSDRSIKGERATGPVEIRAQPFLAACESHRVFMLRASWNQKAREEINVFPNGAHDDIVVALSLAHRRLTRGRFGSAIWGERETDTQKALTQKYATQRLFNKTASKGLIKGVVW